MARQTTKAAEAFHLTPEQRRDAAEWERAKAEPAELTTFTQFLDELADHLWSHFFPIDPLKRHFLWLCKTAESLPYRQLSAATVRLVQLDLHQSGAPTSATANRSRSGFPWLLEQAQATGDPILLEAVELLTELGLDGADWKLQERDAIGKTFGDPEDDHFRRTFEEERRRLGTDRSAIIRATRLMGLSAKNFKAAFQQGKRIVELARERMVKPDTAQESPRWLSREKAAEHLGVDVIRFDKMVRDADVPRAQYVNGRGIWDRRCLKRGT